MKVIVTVLLLVVWSSSAYAQDAGFISNQLTVPPSPEAGQLGTYGEMPVSLSTGTADVSIPLMNLSEGGISIPISLSYQSHGLMVNERPSWVGMGWNLNAGGVISRSARGLPDEALKGFLNKSTEIPNAGVIASDLASVAYRDPVYTRLGVAVDNEYDYVPDAFSYNFGDYGGSFYFGNDGLVHTTQHSALQFDHMLDENGDIVAWRAVDENGLVYEFKEYETTQVTTGSGSMHEYTPASASL